MAFFIFRHIVCIGALYFLGVVMMTVLEPERANAQSHATVLRLPQIESAGAKELTQPNEMKTLMQQTGETSDLVTFNFKSGNDRLCFPSLLILV